MTPEFRQAEAAYQFRPLCLWCRRPVSGDCTATALPSEAYGAPDACFPFPGRAEQQAGAGRDAEAFICADGEGCNR